MELMTGIFYFKYIECFVNLQLIILILLINLSFEMLYIILINYRLISFFFLLHKKRFYLFYLFLISLFFFKK